MEPERRRRAEVHRSPRETREAIAETPGKGLQFSLAQLPSAPPNLFRHRATRPLEGSSTLAHEVHDDGLEVVPDASPQCPDAEVPRWLFFFEIGGGGHQPIPWC